MFRTPIIPAAVLHTPQDQQLAQALAASLQTHRADAAARLAAQSEEEQLAMALALSLSLQSQTPSSAQRSEQLRAERLSASTHRAEEARRARERMQAVVEMNLAQAWSRDAAASHLECQYRDALRRSRFYD